MKTVIFSLFAMLFLAFGLQSCQEKTNNSIVEENSGDKSKQVDDQVKDALKEDGAMVSLPVAATKEPYSTKFMNNARSNFNSFHWQMGGDLALYYNMHMSEFMPTAIASPNEMYKPLVKDIHPELAKYLSFNKL